ncbi:MAG: 1-(5-phosphoribosyl)-5-[(5-phosphoribosylamino)methylideneamino]imidazole-4-carboxamide isomerase [Muribaculum sp.]
MIDIIPAIDIIDGKCVRLTKGDYGQSRVYSDNPLDVARGFEDAGCRRLHLVDLDGAKSHHVVNHAVLERIASHTGLIIDFGGGVKTDEDIRIAFDSGASMVTGGSVAVNQPDTFEHWLTTYGSDRIILGADARDGKISTSGWQHDSEMELIPFIRFYSEKGATQVISTDINVDGTLSGPSIGMYKRILNELPSMYVIASGGVGSMSDIDALNEAGVPAVIVGKAFYEGRMTLKDIERCNY